MEIRELKLLQETAFQVYSKIYVLDFENEYEVLAFLQELKPFGNNLNVTLPVDHLLNMLQGHGYGDSLKDRGVVYQEITNFMIDFELERVLHLNNLKREFMTVH